MSVAKFLLFAGAKWPSDKGSVPSSRPWTFRSPSKARQAVSPRADSCHAFRRRQRMLGEGDSLGRSFQRALLLRTHNRPSTQDGEGSVDVPQGEVWGSGKTGARSSHGWPVAQHPVGSFRAFFQPVMPRREVGSLKLGDETASTLAPLSSYVASSHANSPGCWKRRRHRRCENLLPAGSPMQGTSHSHLNAH